MHWRSRGWSRLWLPGQEIGGEGHGVLSGDLFDSVASSSFISAMLPSVTSFSEGEVFSSWMIARSSSFWHRNSLSRSFKSSNGFVLFSLSPLAFVSLSFLVSLSTSACKLHRFLLVLLSCLQDRIRLHLLKHLMVKMSQKSFTQRFDDSMSSFSRSV